MKKFLQKKKKKDKFKKIIKYQPKMINIPLIKYRILFYNQKLELNQSLLVLLYMVMKLLHLFEIMLLVGFLTHLYKNMILLNLKLN